MATTLGLGQQFPLEVPGFRESRKFLEAWSFIVFPDAPKTISGRENDLKNPKDLRIHKVENVYFSIG
jgi:hypothetical protein